MTSQEAIGAVGITLLWLLPSLVLLINKLNTDRLYRMRQIGPLSRTRVSLVHSISVPLARVLNAAAVIVYPLLLLGIAIGLSFLLVPLIDGGVTAWQVGVNLGCACVLLMIFWRLATALIHQVAVLRLGLRVVGRELQITQEHLSVAIGLLDPKTQARLVWQNRPQLRVDWRDIMDFSVVSGRYGNERGAPQFRLTLANEREDIGIKRYRIQNERQFLLCAHQYLKCKVKVRDRLR